VVLGGAERRVKEGVSSLSICGRGWINRAKRD
jgi:hypothetical protein